MLRGFIGSSAALETDTSEIQFLWLYLPDFNKQGRMAEISYIPAVGQNTSVGAFWN